MNCPACNTEIQPGQTFCPTCRARGGGPPFAQPVARPVVSPVAPPPVANDKHERLFLVLACLLSAGALAIPRLMKSKAFGPTGKLVLGVGAFVNPVAALGLLVWCIVYGPHHIMQCATLRHF